MNVIQVVQNLSQRYEHVTPVSSSMCHFKTTVHACGNLYDAEEPLNWENIFLGEIETIKGNETLVETITKEKTNRKNTRKK